MENYIRNCIKILLYFFFFLFIYYMSLYFIGDSFVFEFFEGSFKTLENCVETFFLFFFYLFIYLSYLYYWKFVFEIFLSTILFFFWDLKFTKILVYIMSLIRYAFISFLKFGFNSRSPPRIFPLLQIFKFRWKIYLLPRSRGREIDNRYGMYTF